MAAHRDSFLAGASSDPNVGGTSGCAWVEASPYGFARLAALESIAAYCRSICDCEVTGTLRSSSALTYGRLSQANQGLVELTGIRTRLAVSAGLSPLLSHVK